MADMNERVRLKQLNRKMVVSAYDCVGTLVMALIVLSLLLSYAFRIVGVDGRSMLPSLKDGDMLLLNIYDDSYRRGDVIVIERYTDTPLVKRVIAFGGETIAIKDDGSVIVNGKVLNESYIRGKTLHNDFPKNTTVTVPHGYLFVMGDNRTTAGSSLDSRSDEIGFISEKDVVGKAIYRVWPIKSIGSV